MPELLGQAVDCYLTPAPWRIGCAVPAVRRQSTAGTTAARPAATEEHIAGLGRLVLMILALFVVGAGAERA